MANIAEGFDCESRLEFARFLVIARRSAVEIQSLLYAALDNHLIGKASFDKALAQAQRTKRIIHALRSSLRHRHPPSPAKLNSLTRDTLPHRPDPIF